MDNLDVVKIFYKEIVPKVFVLVKSFDGNASIVTHKGEATNYATEVDVAVEELIVSEIKTRFPEDEILAEEAYSEVEITDNPIWIIDPICGTSNLGSGRNLFCTNIALAVNKEVVAALVIDHNQQDYFWSTGNNTVFINEEPVQLLDNDRGINIDVDLGSLPKVKGNNAEQDRYFKALLYISKNTNYMMYSLNTSLGFAYVAIGKMDGFMNIFTYPWDIAASAFLIEQAGGVITDLNGKAWEVTSHGFIAAKNKTIHNTLLEAYNLT